MNMHYTTESAIRRHNLSKLGSTRLSPSNTSFTFLFANTILSEETTLDNRLSGIDLGIKELFTLIIHANCVITKF